MLVSVDVEQLQEALNWVNGDLDDFEGLLPYCGKGESGDYEHYYLTMAIYHLTEGGKFLEKIIENATDRLGTAWAPSESADPVEVVEPSKELVKIEQKP